MKISSYQGTNPSYQAVVPKPNTEEANPAKTTLVNPHIQVISNPMAAPEVIMANISNVETKPVLEVNISQYFQANYFVLDDHADLIAGKSALYRHEMNYNDLILRPSFGMWLGNPKTWEVFLDISRDMGNRSEFREVINHVRQHGVLKEGEALPEWLIEELELHAKRFVFSYASRINLPDYGIDTDYLTMPVIDLFIVRDPRLINIGYTDSNLSIFRIIADYDSLLNEYTGVSTMGRLGRELSIEGVELYNLWQELEKEGVVSSYIGRHIDHQGQETQKTSNKWLEIGSNVNIQQLVRGLDIASGLRARLQTYLTSLQRGKKRDNAFNSRYEELKNNYRNEGLSLYLLHGFGMLSHTGMEETNRNYNEVYLPMANEWIGEYEYLEYSLLRDMNSFSRHANQRGADVFYDRFKRIVENQKEMFKGDLPLGQEFLFYLLQENAKAVEDHKESRFYDIQFK